MPLNPTTTEQLRLKAHAVREGDRLIDAPSAGFASYGPFVVRSVTARDRHGLVTFLGDEFLCCVTAEASCLVERETDVDY